MNMKYAVLILAGLLTLAPVFAASVVGAASITTTTGAAHVGARANAEMNADMNGPHMAMVAKGEVNAEGNALRVRTMEHNMVGEMNREVNAVRSRVRAHVNGRAEVNAGAGGKMVAKGNGGMGIEANMGVKGKAGVSGTSGAAKMVMTVNMGGEKRLRVMVEGNSAVIEADGVKVKSMVQVRVEGNMLVSARSGRPIKVGPVKVVQEVKSRVRAETVMDVELVDNGKGPVYVVKAEKPARLFGIIPVSVTVDAEVNAESGSVVAVQRPWWAIFAFGA